MRIRRYAARLLSSTSPSSATTAAPSSPPPPPAASWLHAAADDCCAFCELSRPSPQKGPDAIKHKGHIAGRVPESNARTEERFRQAQQRPAPEVTKCKTDHGCNVNKTSLELKAQRGSSWVSEAAVKPKAAGDAAVVIEADAEPAVSPGPFIVNDAAIGQEVNHECSLLSDSAKPEVTRGDSLLNRSTTDVEVLKGDPFANKAAHDPEVTEKVSPEPGVTSIEPDVTGVPSRKNESGTVLENMMRTSLGKTVTDPGVTIAMRMTGSLSTEGASKAASEPEDSGRVLSNVDDTAALDKPQLPSCNPNMGNVQRGNAGETVAAKGPTVEGGESNGKSVTPNVSCVFDLVARSIGSSGRTDVICYARRRGKRKLELLEVKTENIELEDDVVCKEETLERTGRCESVLSTAGSADVKLVDIKKELELMDSSAASKVKKMKRNRFECNIDYCRMTFKTKAELSVHKTNMCTVKSCSRHFRSHKYLRRHQSVHNDDMPYKCPWDGCVMAFKWSWDRAEHFKIHAGVKPYKCTTPGCNKICKFVSDFTRHRRRCKPQR